MDLCTAYYQCHELHYKDFGSVQVLLEAMREHQRIAPEKLSDMNLELILWNKVPYTLQREVGELKDWALQELFQRLLKAEARVQERTAATGGHHHSTLYHKQEKCDIRRKEKNVTSTSFSTSALESVSATRMLDRLY